MKKIIILLLSLATTHNALSMKNSPNNTDENGRTALHLACITENDTQNLTLAESQRVKIITNCIWWGTIFNTRDNTGKTALDYAALNKDKLPKVYEYMQSYQMCEENNRNSVKYRQAWSVLKEYLMGTDSTSEKP